jgi:predicted amidohydrolase YtcJ
MDQPTYLATSKWLNATYKGHRSCKTGNWKAAERYFRKAVAFSISLELTTHLHSMIDHAVSLRMLGRTEEATQLANTVHKLALNHLSLDQPQSHTLLDLANLVLHQASLFPLEDMYRDRYLCDSATPGRPSGLAENQLLF